MTPLGDRIARACQDALWAELSVHPKPGLVTPAGPGAHSDMSAATFERSIAALGTAFARLAAAGSEAASFARLRTIGSDAETAMLDATGGVNTHRGAIFALGLLAAGAGTAGAEAEPATLRHALLARWGPELSDHRGSASHNGALARRRWHSGGAPAQAAAGFPAVFTVGLPALRRGLDAGLSDVAAAVEALMWLLATIDDTNVLHRGGPGARRVVRSLAAGFLTAGGCRRPEWEAHASRNPRPVCPSRNQPWRLRGPARGHAAGARPHHAGAAGGEARRVMSPR